MTVLQTHPLASDATTRVGVIVAVCAVLLVGIRLLAGRLGRRVVDRLELPDRAMVLTRYRLLVRISQALVVFVGLIAVLYSYPATRSAASAVLASSAVIGLAVGFAARSTLANFVAGVMIAINQPLRLGDRVVVGDAEGTVEDVGLTYTRLRTTDNRRVLIPNEDLTGSRVVNLTLVDPVTLASVRVTTPVTVDAGPVRELLGAVASELPGRLTDRPSPPVAIVDLSGGEAVFSVSAWVGDPAAAGPAQAWMRDQAQRRLNAAGALAGTRAEAAG